MSEYQTDADQYESSEPHDEHKVFTSEDWHSEMAEILLMKKGEDARSTESSDELAQAVQDALSWRESAEYHTSNTELNRRFYGHYTDTLTEIGKLILNNAMDNGVTLKMLKEFKA